MPVSIFINGLVKRFNGELYAVRLDPEYSAGWKVLGRALTSGERAAEAIEAYARGIEVAEGRGDRQAANEMRVFRKRLERAAPSTPSQDD